MESLAFFLTLVAMTYLDFIEGIHNITGKAVCISRPRDSDTTERL